MMLIKNNKIRIVLIILSVCLIVGISVLSFFACSRCDVAYADTGTFDTSSYPNIIDLGYTGLPNMPFLYPVTTTALSSSSTLSQAGSFVMSTIDNSLLNNTLQYNVSSIKPFSISVTGNDQFLIDPTTREVSFTLVCDFGTGYTLPFNVGYYGFFCDFSPYIQTAGITRVPCTLSVVSSSGTSTFDGQLYSSPLGEYYNSVFNAFSLNTNDTIYSFSVELEVPTAGYGVYFSNFRFFIANEVSPYTTYPYHYSTSVLPTNLSTDAYNNGRDSGLSEGWLTGYDEGRKLGYNEGYQSGIQTGSTGGWYDLFSGIFNAPLEAMFGRTDPVTGNVSGGLFNLTIPLGNTTLNMRHFFIGILSCLLVIIVIRIIIKFI